MDSAVIARSAATTKITGTTIKLKNTPRLAVFPALRVIIQTKTLNPAVITANNIVIHTDCQVDLLGWFASTRASCFGIP
jgi:hypothetical protein